MGDMRLSNRLTIDWSQRNDQELNKTDGAQAQETGGTEAAKGSNSWMPSWISSLIGYITGTNGVSKLQQTSPSSKPAGIQDVAIPFGGATGKIERKVILAQEIGGGIQDLAPHLKKLNISLVRAGQELYENNERTDNQASTKEAFQCHDLALNHLFDAERSFASAKESLEKASNPSCSSIGRVYHRAMSRWHLDSAKTSLLKGEKAQERLIKEQDLGIIKARNNLKSAQDALEPADADRINGSGGQKDRTALKSDVADAQKKLDTALADYKPNKISQTETSQI